MQTRRLTAVLVAGLLVLLAVGAVAGIGIGIGIGKSSTPRAVAVIGDSITALATPELDRELRPYHPEIHARFGERIDQMLAVLRSSLGDDPEAVVVNLGTNDAIQARTHPDWRDGFDRMLDLVDSTPCVVLTNISTLKGPPPRPAVAAAINRAIAEADDEHPNIRVLDWNALVHGPNGTALLQPDGIHPSTTGATVLAEMTRRVLDKDCGLAR